MKHVHFVGIGGTGLSAIARLLNESGVMVSGSDRTLSALAKDLIQFGIRVYEGHNAQNIAGADVVVRSSAIPDDNPEVAAAKAGGIPVLKRSEFFGEMLAGKDVIAIAGTHGKTTTTAMMAWVLTNQGLDPSYIIGGVSRNLGNNAHAGQGKHFVIEADEYDRMFMGLQPVLEILTSVEHDHPDCFPTAESYFEAFEAFIGRTTKDGMLLACRDDSGATTLASAASGACRVTTYGIEPNADYLAEDLMQNSKGGMTFSARTRESHELLCKVELQVPGEHNVRNALAVLASVDLLGLDLKKAAVSLGQFNGTGRRFEILGEANGVTVIDDYAHHPTEIAATLKAAKIRFDKRRIWAVWQPHTYSRTRAFVTEYLDAFISADVVLVTEIYAARETSGQFSSQMVVEKINHPNAKYTATLELTTQYLVDHLKPGDVVMVLSAGDADQVSAAVLAAQKVKEAGHA